MNPPDVAFEEKNREPTGLIDNLMVYGLMGIAFFLFFVPLNHLVEYAFFGLLILWVVWQLKNGTLTWIKTSLDIPILLYVVWALICVPGAVDPDYSFGEWRKAIAQFLMVYFVVQTAKTKEQIYSVIFAIVTGVVVLSIIETIDFWGRGRSMWDMRYRAGDLWGSGQWFSTYLMIGLPLLWIGWDTVKDGPRWCRIALGMGLGISLLGLFLAHTRGAWVALGIQVFIYVFLKYRNNWGMAFGGAGILVSALLVLLAFPSVGQNLSASEFTHTGTMQVRYNTWSLALQDIVQNPWTGAGLGKHTFSKLHPDLGDGFHDNLHNLFLGRAVQIGIPGVLLFIWIFVAIVRRASLVFHNFPNVWSGKLAVATSLIVVGVGVRNLFDDMFIGTVAYLFWLAVGLFFSMERSLRTPNSMEV